MSTTDVIPVPTLSTQGLVYDPANKFDMLMAHIFAADSNQSYLYKGRVFSLAGAIQAGGNDKIKIEASIRQWFYDYLNRYYEQVGVQVVIQAIDNSSSALDFQLTINIVDGSTQAQYDKLIRTAHKKLQEIVDLNNYG